MSRISRSLSLKHSFDQYHGTDYGFSAGDYILLGNVKIRVSFKKYEVTFLCVSTRLCLCSCSCFPCFVHPYADTLYLLLLVICLNGVAEPQRCLLDGRNWRLAGLQPRRPALHVQGCPRQARRGRMPRHSRLGRIPAPDRQEGQEVGAGKPSQ